MSKSGGSAAAVVALPSAAHKVYRWMVSNGSSVRTGETIALAVLKDADTANIASASATSNSKFKRPTKRRRPGAASLATEANGASAKPAALASSIPAASAVQTVPIVATADGILSIGGLGPDKNPLAIATIEPCQHPTVIEGLCAVCGKSTLAALKSPLSAAYMAERSSKQQPNMSRVTVSGGITVSVSETEGMRMAQQDAERLRKQRKLSLVLDLDHTLVHATSDARAREHLGKDDVRSLLLPMAEAGPPPRQSARHPALFLQHFVKFRPHVKEFLEKAADHYEIGVYTAGTREYAEQVTLVLSRHLVGASRDQIDIDHLRAGVHHMETELEQKAKELASDKAVGKEADVNDSTKSSEDEEANKSPEPNGSTPAEESRGTTRKRVTFGEPPESTKSDHTTKEDLKRLKQDLTEAEKLESYAVDLNRRLFGRRVVSRTDVGDLGRDVKSLKRIFPCGGTMAAVLDDREDVWANAEESNSGRRGEPPDNLLLVRPYHWDTFMGFADLNNAAGVDLSQGPSKEKPQGQSELDQQLRWSLDILLRLHERYYASTGSNWVSVPEILGSMRREVLKGCNVVLSGLVPLNRENATDDSSRPRPGVVRYVESLGGTVMPSVTSATTHVVGAKDGSEKIKAARRIPGCLIVKPSWLMECVWTVTRRDETEHLLGPVPTAGPGAVVKPPADSKNENSSGSSDEDDELAAAFEEELMGL